MEMLTVRRLSCHITISKVFVNYWSNAVIDEVSGRMFCSTDSDANVGYLLIKYKLHKGD